MIDQSTSSPTFRKTVVGIVNQTIVRSALRGNFRVDPEKAQRAGFGIRDFADIQAAMMDCELTSNMIRGDGSSEFRAVSASVPEFHGET